MLETCKSCGTVFEVDETIITKKIQWFKCGVCNKKWNSSLILDKNLTSEVYENKNKSERVKSELASIKSVVEDKSKKLAKKSNPVLDQKNKSVAEIASELSISKLNENPYPDNKKLEKRENKKNINNRKKLSLSQIFIFLIISIISVFVLFRSLIISYGFVYFPNYTKTHISKINKLFTNIELPILAQTNHLTLTNFVATLQKKEVKIVGVIKNKSNIPLLTPRVKILAIREDRKIIFEKTLILEKQIVPPNSEIAFNKLLKIQIENKKENITVKASFLKKVFD